MNNKRKDILKKGIDVTLYPLPFRKGGKIMNAGMGDKTVKPGIEYGGGGGLPKINDLGKAKVQSDATRTVNPRAEATKMGITQRPTETLHKTTTGLFNYTTPGVDKNRMVRPKSKFNLGGVLNGGGGEKKPAHVSRFGDTTYAAPEMESNLPVVNRYGFPFYRLGRTEFQMIPGVEYPELSTLTGPRSTTALPLTTPEFTPAGQQPGPVGQRANLSLGKRKSKFGM